MQKISSDLLTKVVVLKPLTEVLPTVSPIRDLLESTNALERGNGIYWTMYLGHPGHASGGRWGRVRRLFGAF